MIEMTHNAIDGGLGAVGRDIDGSRKRTLIVHEVERVGHRTGILRPDSFTGRRRRHGRFYGGRGRARGGRDTSCGRPAANRGN